MIEMNHKSLSKTRQCELLDVNRNRLNPPQTKMTEEDELIMRELDETHTAYPFYGQRNLQHVLKKKGLRIGRGRIRRLMRVMGIESLAPKPSLSKPNKKHKIYPYLLRNLAITEVDQVWCTDITYLPMEKGS